MFSIYDGRTELVQWDLDRKLIIDDPSIKQVHFCNRTGFCSIVRNAYIVNGMCLVDIPNIILQDTYRLNVYGYTANYTKYVASFNIIPRTKPETYVYTETEVAQWEALESRITQIEENGITEEAVAAAVESYLEENPIEGGEIDPELIQQVAANTERIEALENKPSAACECKVLRLKYISETNTVEINKPIEEVANYTLDELRQMDITLTYQGKTMYPTAYTLLGIDGVDGYTIDFTTLNGNVNGFYAIGVSIYVNKTTLKAEMRNPTILDLPRPNPNDTEHRYQLTSINGVAEWQLCPEPEEEEEEAMPIIPVIDDNGTLMFADNVVGITPIYVLENLGEKALELSLMVAASNGANMKLYKISAIDAANYTIDFVSGFTAIHWAADGSLSYVPLFTDGEGVSY